MGEEEANGNGHTHAPVVLPPVDEAAAEEVEDAQPARVRTPVKRKPKPALRKGVLS